MKFLFPAYIIYIATFLFCLALGSTDWPTFKSIIRSSTSIFYRQWTCDKSWIYRNFSLILWLKPRNLVYLFREPHYLKMKCDIMKVLCETSDLEVPLGRRITWRISLALFPGWWTHHKIWKACPQLLWRHHAPLNPEIRTNYFHSMLNDITKWIKTWSDWGSISSICFWNPGSMTFRIGATWGLFCLKLDLVCTCDTRPRA